MAQRLTGNDISRAVTALKSGNVVAIPTETVYGLAADCFNEYAVGKVFEIKSRPKFDPLIVHVSPNQMDSKLSLIENLKKLELINAENISEDCRTRIERLAERFWPGPLTLVLPKSSKISDLVTSGLPTVAIRMPSNPVAQRLIDETGPLAAPSANRFGKISPTSSEDVQAELGDRIDYILEGGNSTVGVESTVVTFAPFDRHSSLTILRPGFITREEIELLLQEKVSTQSDSEKILAPGQLKKHYSPEKRLCQLPAPISDMSGEEIEAFIEKLGFGVNQVSLIVFSESRLKAAKDWQDRLAKKGLKLETHALSKDGNLIEVAKNLFSTLRRLDSDSSNLIITEPCLIKSGLGHAINDRLDRATTVC